MAKSKEEIKEYNKLYYIKNKEYINKKNIDNYVNNRDKIRVRHEEYNINNKEYIKEYQREWYVINKERLSAHSAAYYKDRRTTAAGRASHLCSSCKKRSIKKGVDFDLDTEWIMSRIKDGCAVTGYVFVLETSSKAGADMFTPSIDRINPIKGYTKDNVQVVCFGVNVMKGSNNMSDVYRLAEMIVHNRQTKESPQLRGLLY